MHKLTKGLKKKKKGKKSKRKEEELFKPEELEAYRREHAATGEGSSAKNEEWRNFLSLTSGVDDILKKTQDDLDRIKSTSFFQRKPTASEVKKAEEEELARSQQLVQQSKEEPVKAADLGIVPVSESESEEDDEDDIFDTAYIDAIAAGEVKLAYIPESPIDKTDGDDPFDTSYAEKAILGPAVNKKGKKLVPIGAAVEVLTGRVQLPTCATKPAATRRRVLKDQDLLLGSFDSGNQLPISTQHVEEPVKTLLDDDEIPLPDEPIDLSKSLYIPPPPPVVPEPTNHIEEDEDDKEFEALAAESLSKPSAPSSILPQPIVAAVVEEVQGWKPFAEENQVEEYVDPFDTTFAENIIPGKAELKVIEREILENDVDFDPRVPVELPVIQRVPESHLKLITPVHRDLLGGSTSDLSKLGEIIQPTEENDIKYCDPFNTSIAETVAPGKAELKYLEKELLGDIPPSKPRSLSRPDVLNVQNKSVTFSVAANKDCLDESNIKVGKPLTPFYVRKNSVPGELCSDDDDEDFNPRGLDLLSASNDVDVAKVLTPQPEEIKDPFDTSSIAVCPSKAELKILENELIEPKKEETQDLLVHNGDTIIKKPLSPQQSVAEEFDPFDTSFAANIQPGRAELKVLESELI